MAQLDAARGGRLHPAARPAAQGVASLRTWAIRLLGALIVVMALGSTWDVKWHYSIGRDSFWIPPHLMLYSAVALAGLLCAGVVLYETWRGRSARSKFGDATSDGTMRVLGFRGPLGLFIAGFGFVTMLTAAPFDDLWHRMYGVDVAIWSPPHMLGIVGGGVVGFGGLVAAAHERRRRGGRGADMATLFFLMTLVGNGSFILIPAVKMSFWPHVPSVAHEPFADNLLFYPVLGSFLLTYPLVAAARIFGWRRAWFVPLAVLGVFVLLRLLESITAEVGFAALVPWGDQRIIRPPIVIERNLWDHPILLALPTLVLSLCVRATGRPSLGRAALLTGGAFGLAMMLETIVVFLMRNPHDMLDMGTVGAGLALAPLLGALVGLLGALVGRWLGDPDPDG